ncbi:hypothetical protein RUND412_009131 [Rhizina undulata]
MSKAKSSWREGRPSEALPSEALPSEALPSEVSPDAAMPYRAIAFPAEPSTPREPSPRKLLADGPPLKDPWGALARRLADYNGREGGSQEHETKIDKINHEQLMRRMANVVGDWR